MWIGGASHTLLLLFAVVASDDDHDDSDHKANRILTNAMQTVTDLDPLCVMFCSDFFPPCVIVMSLKLFVYHFFLIIPI